VKPSLVENGVERLIGIPEARETEILEVIEVAAAYAVFPEELAVSVHVPLLSKVRDRFETVHTLRVIEVTEGMRLLLAVAVN